ncbi:MAG TPA: VWA domain-containing protein [Paludibaculum sp.]|jgi:Ca-activated chloride channel family protein
MRPWLLLLSFLSFLQPPPRADLQVDVSLSNVSFTVRDRNGALQPSLNQRDFTVLEDGVPQQIRFFSRDFSLPLSLGILMDLSGSQDGLVAINISLARDFLRNILQPADSVFVAAFDSRIRLIQEFTSSVPDIEDAILHVRERSKKAPVLGKGKGNASPVREAIYLCTREKLKPVRGRKAPILISDGNDNASRVSVADTIEMLQSADTILYAVNPGTSALDKVAHVVSPTLLLYDRLTQHNHLQRISAESGGDHFKVRGIDLKATYRRIEDELRTMYVLSYVSTNTNYDGKWRKVEIRPNLPGLVVRARLGYRAVSPRTVQ